LFRVIFDEETIKKMKEIAKTPVQWMYEMNEEMKEFDEEINLKIESSRINKDQQLKLM
jgi:predicted transcriptional regulator